MPEGQDKITTYHRIREQHHTMKRMTLLGCPIKEIAATCECTERTVINVLNSPIMKRELELMRACLDKKAIDIAEEVQRLAPQAVVVLQEILEDDTAPIHLRARVAMDNLSRNGISPVMRGSLSINHTLNGEEIDQIKRRAYEAGMRNGTLIDVNHSQTSEDETQSASYN
jgi:DNA-binding transcriptional MerR regulator